MYSWQRFFPILWVFSLLNRCFHSCKEAFQFYEIPLVNCWPYFLGKWSSILKVLSYSCILQVLPMFGSISFIVSDFKLRSSMWSYFLCRAIDMESSFILIQVTIQFSQHCLLKAFSFLQCIFLTSLSSIRQLTLYVLMLRSSILCPWPSCLFCTSAILFLLL